MPREYILSPKLGFSVEDAIENTSEENATIEVYEYGIYKATYPVNALSLQIFKPQPHPSYMRQQHMVLREGEKVLKKPIQEDYLTTDVNPYFQIIQRIVKDHEECSIETILRILVHDWRLFSENRKDFKVVKKLVEKMHDDGMLVTYKKNYRVGLEIGMGDRLIPLVRGYDPFEWEIMQFIENRGLVSSHEIHNHIVSSLKWTKNDGLIENYLRRLMWDGFIEKIGDYYKYLKRLNEVTGTVEKKPL